VALFAVAVLAGAGLGLLRGGRPRRLRGLRLRAAPLVWAAVATQALLGLGGDAPPAGVRDVALVASYAAVGAWLAVNAWRGSRALAPGFALLAAGWALNVVPMALNDGMPVSAAALRTVGLEGVAVEDGNFWKHVPATGATDVAWLGDVIPVPPARAVVSPGDLVLLLGLGAVVAAALTAPAARTPTAAVARP
jgi:hypothetical protein